MLNSKLILNEYGRKTDIREDAPVIDFLKKLNPDMEYNYLEVGAGFGRFSIRLKKEHDLKNINITCLEINKGLSDNLISKGLKTINGSVLNMPFNNDSFDILHCSHIIEHFGYPDIIKVLDEIFRITKKGGYVIIRSPLMHPNFYNDIDHVRPYSPKTLIQHFNNPQQQKKGNYTIKTIKTWDRKQAKEFKTDVKGLWLVNIFLKKMWNIFGWPTAKVDGYVAIFQKI